MKDKPTMNTITRHQNEHSRRWSRAQLGVIVGLVAIGLIILGRSPRAATGTLVPVLYQTVQDSNGNPISGAKVCTYLAGTTTPTTTYSDVNLTTPAGNPITADSAGRWVAYLTPGVGYKFILQDATGTVNVCNGAAIRTVDNVVGLPTTVNPTTQVNTADVRVTLTTAVPVTTADVTAATTVYVTPYRGNKIALYDGTQWNIFSFAETPIAIAGFAASTNYDVFASSSGASVVLTTTNWASDSARGTALAVQDGVLVKSGTATQRYLATFRTTGTIGQTEDSATKRFVWNYYNRVRRPLLKQDATATWTYSLATVRLARADATNQVDVVVGWPEVAIDLTLMGIAYNNNASAVDLSVGISEDSTTVYQNGVVFTAGSSIRSTGSVRLAKLPAVGRHYYAWLEWATATGTTTWHGTNTFGSAVGAGLTGWIEG